jgi:hypothetical protein
VLPDTRHGLVHIDVLLPRNDTPFFRRMRQALQRSMQMLDRRIVLHRQILPEDDDDVITRAILEPPYARAGLIITTHDTANAESRKLTLNDVWGVMPSTVRWLILRPTRFSFTRDRDGVAQVRFQHLDPTHVTP